MKSNKHGYVVTEPIDEMKGLALPNMKVSEDGIYTRVSGQSIILGGFEGNPTFLDKVEDDFNFGLFDLDWDIFQPYLDAHHRLMPLLKHKGIKTTICGPETFVPDGKPIFGETPEVRGLFLNCGENSRGIQSSGGLGREMANLIADSNGTSINLDSYDVARFHEYLAANDAWLTETVQEFEVRILK